MSEHLVLEESAEEPMAQMMLINSTPLPPYKSTVEYLRGPQDLHDDHQDQWSQILIYIPSSFVIHASDMTSKKEWKKWHAVPVEFFKRKRKIPIT
ncbi:hypothetical protein NC652_027133 [Populus alba x Populus x berolinensis]|nr:hypothetical protein NC652_027133 [Populus alba x Populus x berolinensis]